MYYYYQRALAHRLGFEPGSPDYETTELYASWKSIMEDPLHLKWIALKMPSSGV